MENEMLKIFDDNKTQIGIASSRRSSQTRNQPNPPPKKKFFFPPPLFFFFFFFFLKKDITAAGHLLAHETVFQDGIREIKEELGIDVSSNELELLGIIDYCVEREDFIDKEIANIFSVQVQSVIRKFQNTNRRGRRCF